MIFIVVGLVLLFVGLLVAWNTLTSQIEELKKTLLGHICEEPRKPYVGSSGQFVRDINGELWVCLFCRGFGEISNDKITIPCPVCGGLGKFHMG